MDGLTDIGRSGTLLLDFWFDEVRTEEDIRLLYTVIAEVDDINP